ncbi:MAG: hypothetical protein IJK44_05120 [Bacteroidales bacterium]|jgi:hypothetical protein|nr:hypothetical protein [Bacteroidales bacterium]
METGSAISHRKLIDISSESFKVLSNDAYRQSVSLKKYIENMLESRAREIEARNLNVSPSIMRLIGSALPANGRIEDIDDDRLQYLLSK